MLRGGFVDVVAQRALGREVASGFEAEIEIGGAFGCGEDAGSVCMRGGEGGGKLVLGQIQRVAFERAVAAAGVARDAQALIVEVGNVGQAFFARADGGLVYNDHVVLREVVKQSRQLLFKQREPVLHAR